nr:sensor histidine kinase [Luteolibacter marinus]
MIALLLTCLFPLHAAERRPMMVRVWQSEDGLPGNVVRSMVQSADGYLWVATAEGVARFDGIDFDPIEPDGELRRVRFAFWRLFSLPDGRVWVATFQGGLFRIRDNRLEQVVRPPQMSRPPRVSQLVADATGSVFAMRGDEILLIAAEGPVPVTDPSDDMQALFARDYEKQVAGGRAVVPENEPFLQSRSGERWSGDANAGLTVTGTDGVVTPVSIPGISHPYTFNELLEDREGNVWVATPVNGLVRVRHGRVDLLSTSDGLFERAVFAVLEDSGGKWWIANRRSGLDVWTDQGTRHIDLVTTGNRRPAAAIFEDRDKRLWVGSRGGSVFLLKDGSFEPQFSRSQTPSKVRAIQQTRDGLMWFGGENGLASFDGTTVRDFGPEDGFPGSDVTVLVTGPGKSIFAGTSDGRVLLGGRDGFRQLGNNTPIDHWWISGLHPVGDKELWATTLGGGLFLWNGSTWHRFATADGIPDLRLTSILDDGQGHFWFGSLGGILRASRRELLMRLQGAEQPLHWLRLDRSDGLPTRECIGGYQPAGWRGDDGRLWFPTGSGVVRVRPDLVEVNKVPPPVYLQSTRVNGRQQEHSEGAIEAGPGRTRLEFRFVGLSYSAPEKVTYRARLDGLDDTWRELGDQRVAAFEAVPPGRYTFEVMAVNGDGVWSTQPARVSIRVTPHFWESAWFIVGVTGLTLLCAAMAGWAIARRRMKRRIQALKIRHAREAERARIARDLHDDLGASLTEISILSALAAEEEDESSMRPSLNQLSRKAKSVVGTLDEIVWAVNPREDTLRSLVDYLAAYARDFLSTAGISLRTDISRSIPDQPLDTTVRHGVFMAAREALNNLVKHSQASEARLSVHLTPRGLEIQIEDNGRGFSQEWEAKGYGVTHLSERMQACGGDCSLTSIPGTGVTVTLTLPLLADPSPET